MGIVGRHGDATAFEEQPVHFLPDPHGVQEGAIQIENGALTLIDELCHHYRSPSRVVDLRQPLQVCRMFEILYAGGSLANPGHPQDRWSGKGRSPTGSRGLTAITSQATGYKKLPRMFQRGRRFASRQHSCYLTLPGFAGNLIDDGFHSPGLAVMFGHDKLGIGPGSHLR